MIYEWRFLGKELFYWADRASDSANEANERSPLFRTRAERENSHLQGDFKTLVFKGKIAKKKVDTPC